MKRKKPIEDSPRKRFKPSFQFNGENYFCNQLDSELPSEGRIPLEDIIPFKCQCAILTAFDVNNEWLQQYFHRVPSMLIVEHDPTRKSKLGSPIISQDSERLSWIYLKVKPSGLMHAKLMIFRLAHSARVVISSANLVAQWQKARDILWIQDFPIVENLGRCRSEFGTRLRDFLTHLCKSPSFIVDTFISDVFRDVDFSNAKAHLVESFPNRTNNLTGHLRLREVISDHVNWGGCASLNPVTAIAGSLGKYGGSTGLNPTFLREMESVFQGKQVLIREGASWEDIKLLNLLWPTISTGLESSLEWIFLQKFLNKAQWQALPQIGRMRFFDAVPNFEGVPDEMGCPARPPIHHAKAFLRISQTRHPSKTKAWIYIGSHNFSKAAWGLGKTRPKNVELGVFLHTKEETMRDEWVNRFPFRLPSVDKSVVCYGASRSIEPFVAGAQYWFANRNDSGRKEWWKKRIIRLESDRDVQENQDDVETDTE